MCEQCHAGFYRGNEDNNNKCNSCAQGQFTDKKGQPFCISCDQGFFQDQRGQVECDVCSEGQIQPEKGKNTCQKCALEGYITNPARTFCTSPDYMVASDCKTNEYLNDTSLDKNQWSCFQCPKGADCVSIETKLSSLRSNKGWWRIPEKYKPGSTLFARCPFPQDCLPASVNEPKCSNETTHDLCSRCKVGYDRIASKCTKCSNNEVGVRIAVLCILLLLIVAGVYRARKKLHKLHKKYRHAMKDSVMAIKILISFLQINMTMPTMLSSVQWPEEYVIFLNRLSFVNIDIMSIVGVQCVVDVDFRVSLMVSLCVPVITFFCVALAYYSGLRRIHRKAHSRRQQMKDDDFVDVDALNKLFDLADFNMSGVIDEEELRNLFEWFAHEKKAQQQLKYLTQAKLSQMMLSAGGEKEVAWDANKNQQVDVVVLDKETFVAALTPHTTVVQAKDTTAKASSYSLSHFLPAAKLTNYVSTQRLRSNCLSLMVQLFLLFHAPVSARGFYYFDCHRLGDSKSLLRRDYSLECGGDRYNQFLPAAWTLLVAFAVGLPLTLGLYLFYHRNGLHSPTTHAKIGWLYTRFTVGAEFWELHEVLRKMTLTGLLIYMPEEVRAPGAIIVCVVACCTLNYYRPHQSRIVFWIAEASFVLTTFKYLVAVFAAIKGSDLEKDDVKTLGSLLIALDVMILVGGNLCVIAVFVLMRNSINEIKKIDKSEKQEKLVSSGSSGSSSHKVHPRSSQALTRKQSRSRLTIENVKQIVVVDKVVKFQKRHAEQHEKSLNVIRARKKIAAARVRQRLIKRRNSRATCSALPDLVASGQETKTTKKDSSSDINELKNTAQNKIVVDETRQAVLLKVKTEKQLHAVFRKLDLDNSGLLSKGEFQRLIEASLMKKVNVTTMNVVWNAAWEQRKHGKEDEMDATTLSHWLGFDQTEVDELMGTNNNRHLSPLTENDEQWARYFEKDPVESAKNGYNEQHYKSYQERKARGSQRTSSAN